MIKRAEDREKRSEANFNKNMKRQRKEEEQEIWRKKRAVGETEWTSDGSEGEETIEKFRRKQAEYARCSLENRRVNQWKRAVETRRREKIMTRNREYENIMQWN